MLFDSFIHIGFLLGAVLVPCRNFLLSTFWSVLLLFALLPCHVGRLSHVSFAVCGGPLIRFMFCLVLLTALTSFLTCVSTRVSFQWHVTASSSVTPRAPLMAVCALPEVVVVLCRPRLRPCPSCRAAPCMHMRWYRSDLEQNDRGMHEIRVVSPTNFSGPTTRLHLPIWHWLSCEAGAHIDRHLNDKIQIEYHENCIDKCKLSSPQHSGCTGQYYCLRDHAARSQGEIAKVVSYHVELSQHA
jgi:hypothetical protein